MNNLIIDLAFDDLNIEGIMYPRPQLGKTEVVYWYTSKNSERIEKQTLEGILCGKATNFCLNLDGFTLE
tara:strand:- start:160 stop:366 length:207 start_codon:yes stop_codon:yes gene_type:complete